MVKVITDTLDNSQLQETTSPFLRLTVALMDPLEPLSGYPELYPITSTFFMIWRCTFPFADKNEVVK
jgi:hypothetical protein